MKTKNITPSNWEFSLFFNTEKGLFNCTPYKTINLKRLFEIYQSPYLITKSKELSQASDEDKKVIKSQLPYITYSGTFSYRNNESLISYNSSLLPLDIDGLSIEEAIKVQKILSEQPGCVMSIISPRGKGVKALIFLGVEVEFCNHYTTLTNNIEAIAKHLNIQEFESKIDPGQFKLCQPFFIAYSEYNFFNENATPTNWAIENFEKKVIEYKAPNTTNYTPQTSIEQKRIYSYFNKIVSDLEKLFSDGKEGYRHSLIWRVGGVASSLHYAPYLHSEMKLRLFNAIVRMYKDEKEAKNTRAIKTFEDIWGNAQPKYNKIIEQIINECSINLNHLNND